MINWLVAFGNFLESHNGAIIALATIVIAAFTIKLASATRNLSRLANQQEASMRRQERAYLIGGGPRKLETDKWIMTIHNVGRTPAFITKVEWGLCPENDFPLDISVSKIIDSKKISVQTVNDDNVVPPALGTGPISYRHVVFWNIESRGKIFFGRLFFKDIFGDRHHSTFKLKLTSLGSDTLEGSYSEDWE